MKVIPEADYNAKLKEFLATQERPPGMGFFGNWAWHGKMEDEFRRQYGIRPMRPESAARPGSFSDFWRHTR